MSNKITLFNLPFSNLDYTQAVQEILVGLQTPGFKYALTLNPEIVLASKTQPKLMQAVQKATWLFADGIGLVLGAKLLGKPGLKKLTGVDLTNKLLAQPNLKFYFLGAKPEVLAQAMENVRIKYPHVQIVGSQHGYFATQDHGRILAEIKSLRPDVVLVALGCPKQEEFLAQLSLELNHGFGMGVGGVFDVLSGFTKRAPGWSQRVGLEWLCRGLREPSRMKRWVFIPRYIKLLCKDAIYRVSVRGKE